MAKKQPSADDILKQMYPDLMTSDDYAAAEAAKKKAAEPDPNAQIAALTAQIATLQSQISGKQTSDSLLSVANDVDAPPMRPTIDYSKAPDPVQEPAAYAQFVANATQATINYEKEAWAWQQRQASAQANSYQMLWDTFSEKYKAYAKNDERVEIATQRVLQKAKAAGKKTDEYMYGKTDQFLQDVVSTYDKLFGKPQDVDASAEDDDDDDNRTDMFGGASAGPTGLQTPKAPPQKYGALSTDILEWQTKSGFHR